MQERLRENRPGNRGWERFGGKHSEDHLGAALIKPGGIRYRQMKVAGYPRKGGGRFRMGAGLRLSGGRIWSKADLGRVGAGRLQKGWHRVQKMRRPLQ